MILEEALILPGRRPLWYSCCSSRVGQANGGGVRYASILLGQKDVPEVAVLTSTEVDLDQRCIQHQDLMYLLDGGVVGIECMLGG